MLKGIVNLSGEPLVKTILLSINGRQYGHDAIIDTGFNGSLSIPEKLAKRYQWKWAGYESYEVATGDIVQQNIYLGYIAWFGKNQEVYAVSTHSRDILIGTSLLVSQKLTINFKKRTLLLNFA